MKRFTLPDLIDKKNLIAWLSYDGEPPTVTVRTGSDYVHGRGICPTMETKPVADEETLAKWWSDHRHALALEWSKSTMNTNKPQTRTQWIAECLRFVGIKGFGTVAQRVQRAIAFRPDLYKDAKTVEAEEDAQIAALKLQLNLTNQKGSAA